MQVLHNCEMNNWIGFVYLFIVFRWCILAYFMILVPFTLIDAGMLILVCKDFLRTNFMSLSLHVQSLVFFLKAQSLS